MGVRYKRKSNVSIPESEADKYIYRNGTKKPIGVARNYKRLIKFFPWNFLIEAAKYSENVNLDGIVMDNETLGAVSNIMLRLYGFKTHQSRTAFYLRFIEQRTISDIQEMMGGGFKRKSSRFVCFRGNQICASWLGAVYIEVS